MGEFAQSRDLHVPLVRPPVGIPMRTFLGHVFGPRQILGDLIGTVGPVGVARDPHGEIHSALSARCSYLWTP